VGYVWPAAANLTMMRMLRERFPPATVSRLRTRAFWLVDTSIEAQPSAFWRRAAPLRFLPPPAYPRLTSRPLPDP